MPALCVLGDEEEVARASVSCANGGVPVAENEGGHVHTHTHTHTPHTQLCILKLSLA